MSMNKLKLNDEKTEFLVMTSRYQQHKIHDHNIKVDTATIHASKSARNLGIIFDNNLCMDEHVKRICQTVYFHIRNVNSIRKILTTETAATIIHALITSRIDNGNSLLTGISEHLLRKLQLAQNAAACILTKTKKFEHITPVLKELHWLPVRERIQFKLLVLTWKSLNGIAPQYLSNLLVPYKPIRAHRSSDKHLLVVPRTLSLLGDRAFSAIAPSLWNSLPLDIRCCDFFQSFKNLLKTHLYNKAYIYIDFMLFHILSIIFVCFNCMFLFSMFAPRNSIFIKIDGAL